MPDEVKVNRQHAVREEIDMAIDLLLTREALVSANLLAWAAIDVLQGVAVSRGLKTLGSSIGEMIKPEKLNEWYRHLKEHYNFSKHADKDPHKVMNFSREIVIMSIFQACMDYSVIYSRHTFPMIIIKAWILATKPDLLNDSESVLGRKLKNFPLGTEFSDLCKFYSVYTDYQAEILDMVDEDHRAMIEIRK